MSEVQETFVSHLVELRDRLLRAIVAVVVVFVCLMPWAADIYDLLARPIGRDVPRELGVDCRREAELDGVAYDGVLVSHG